VWCGVCDVCGWCVCGVWYVCVSSVYVGGVCVACV